MSNLSFLSYQKPFSRRNTHNPKRQPSMIKTTPSLSQTNQWSFNPNTQEMRRVFDRYDANKDGKISLAEYKAALRAVGTRDDAAAKRMFEVADRDGDGFIDFEEFVGVNTAGGGVRMSEIKSAFRVFDIDGDGRISAEELAEVLRRIGEEGCGVEACRRMVKGVDKDGDGLIDMDEFITMMTRRMN